MPCVLIWEYLPTSIWYFKYLDTCRLKSCLMYKISLQFAGFSNMHCFKESTTKPYSRNIVASWLFYATEICVYLNILIVWLFSSIAVINRFPVIAAFKIFVEILLLALQCYLMFLLNDSVVFSFKSSFNKESVAGHLLTSLYAFDQVGTETPKTRLVNLLQHYCRFSF